MKLKVSVIDKSNKFLCKKDCSLNYSYLELSINYKVGIWYDIIGYSDNKSKIRILGERTTYDFSIDEFYFYFYTPKEIRKLKLKQIDVKSR